MILAENKKMGKPAKKRGSMRFAHEIPYHLMLWPGVIFTFIFAYLPMFGVIMAFQDFKPVLSFADSRWVGWDNFSYMMNLQGVWQAVRNTLYISFLKMALLLIVPLILALLINEVYKNNFKKAVQTILFLPFFLSWAVLGGMMRDIFSLDGMVNNILMATGLKKEIFFLGSNVWFPVIVILSDVWKGMGYNMIIFLAAITNIDPNLHEAAAIDGCNRWRQMWNITLPSMAPIIVLIAVLSIGGLLNAGFDQIFILYNPLVYTSSDIIDTFVYRLGILNAQYSVSAAVGLFKSAVSVVLVGLSYYLAYKYSNYRIF
jgi:putative aldouronate transport system permease protein